MRKLKHSNVRSVRRDATGTSSAVVLRAGQRTKIGTVAVTFLKIPPQSHLNQHHHRQEKLKSAEKSIKVEIERCQLARIQRRSRKEHPRRRNRPSPSNQESDRKVQQSPARRCYGKSRKNKTWSEQQKKMDESNCPSSHPSKK